MGRLRQLLSRERELKMIWEVGKGEGRSYLAGSVHFFPYHFHGSLRRYISQVDVVLFEGPLDEESARTVVEYGTRGEEGAGLLDALDPGTLRKIERDLGTSLQSLSSHRMYRSLFGPDPDSLDWDRIRGLRPWMAFFRIWSHYLRKHGWIYTMELDALRIASALGKSVHFLETIQEQLEALDNIPFERFVHFFKNASWEDSRRDHLECYLHGDLEGLATKIGAFPTVCESIIQKRDPILYRRMMPFFEKGRTIAFVGTAHCRGIKAFLLEDSYRVGLPAGS
jgi:hypothetical protein